MPRRETSLSEFIRDYLQENGDAYVLELHRGYSQYCDREDYSPPSYDSVRSTVWQLKELDLIRPTRTKPVPGGIADRQYYRLANDALDRDWSDPRGELYGR